MTNVPLSIVELFEICLIQHGTWRKSGKMGEKKKEKCPFLKAPGQAPVKPTISRYLSLSPRATAR